MMRSLWTAASGMMAQQTNLDTVANNLANVNTPGFKRTRIEFQDLLYDTIRPADPATYGGYAYVGTASPRASIQVGQGVRLSGSQKVVSAGNIEATGNRTDLAIDGAGYFRVRLTDGTYAYTRDGTFRLDSGGRLVTADGFALMSSGLGQITIPTGVKELSISASGEVASEQGHHGTIGITTFRNPAGLEAIGKNLLKSTAASGDGVTVTPGAVGAGSVLQGYVERSNVQVVEEMVNLIIVQRAYEMNSKAAQTSDDVMGMTNNIVRR